MSVLSVLSRSTVTTATLLSRMIEAQQQKSARQIQSITDLHQTQINRLNRDGDKWKSVKSDVGKAASSIHANLGRAKAILGKLDSMLLTVNKAGHPSPDGTTINTDAYAVTFDSMLKGLSKNAEGGRSSPNLLGKAEPKLTYRTHVNGSTASVQGAYIGTDYHIIDSEGKRWVLNRDAKNLKRYDNYPNSPTSTVGTFQNGIRLDSISGDAIDFTIAPETATPQSFSGTIYRDGLRVQDSWYYGNLGTQAERDRAATDLKSAKVAMELEVKRYELAASTASFYEDRALAEIKGIRAKVNDEMIARAEELQKSQAKLNQEFQVTNSIVAQSLSLKNAYANMLGTTANDKLTQILIDVVT